MFSSFKSQSHYKRSFYLLFSSSATTCPFNPWQYAMRYRGATKRSAGQTLKRTQTYMFRVENVFNAFKSTSNRPCRVLYTILPMSVYYNKTCFVSKMFLTRLSPLRTDLVECYTPYFQCQSTTIKLNTLLWLTETEHISLHFTIYQLPNTLRITNHHVLNSTYWCSSNPQIKTFIHRIVLLSKKIRKYPRLLFVQFAISVDM